MRVEKKKKKKNKRGLVITIIVIVLVVAGAGFSMFYGLLPDVFGIFEPSIIKVGIFDLNLPPLFYEDANGNLVGFEIDLLNEVAGRLGWDVEYVRVNDKYGDALNAKEVDVVWGNVPDMAETRESLLLTRPYLRTNQVAVVLDNSVVTKTDDLNDNAIGTVLWTPAERYVKDGMIDLRTTQIGAAKDYYAAFDSVRKEYFVALICDETLAEYVIKKLDDEFVNLPEPLGEVSYSVAFRLNDTITCERVQSALDAVAADGTGERLSQQWFGKSLYIN